MERAQKNPHAILIAYPLQGHFNPLVLAIKMASKGFTITFINTEYIHHRITKSQPAAKGPDTYNIFSEAVKSGLDIRYATVSDGLPVSFDRFLNLDQFNEALPHVISAHVDEIVGNFVQKDPTITTLIADTFFVWPSKIANKYNLVNVSFWTEPALILTQYYHLDLLKANAHFACDGSTPCSSSLYRFFSKLSQDKLHRLLSSVDKRQDTIDYLPGVDAIEPKDLTSYVQATDVSTVVHRIIYQAVYGDAKRADVVICNTVQELEPKTLWALNQNQPTYAIGPLFPTGFAKSVVDTSLWAESECSKWLNSKPNGSVLYISFGSLAQCSKEEITEIAHGLLLSKVSFIWVLRPNIVSSDETDFLPVGFEEEIKERGLIVPWCRQIEVISHPMVGGVLTHCGWNTILESIWCGLPLLCFPLFADQFTNRKLVLDDWGVGLNLFDQKPIRRDEVRDKINRLMNGKKSDGEDDEFDLRKNVKKVKEKLEDASWIIRTKFQSIC